MRVLLVLGLIVLLSGCCGGFGCTNYTPYVYQGYRSAPSVVVNINKGPEAPAVTTTTTTTVSQ